MSNPSRKRKRVWVIEWRRGSGVTRSISETAPYSHGDGIIEPVFQSEIDSSEEPCESEEAYEAYEGLIRDDIYMQTHFARLRRRAVLGRGEVPA